MRQPKSLASTVPFKAAKLAGCNPCRIIGARHIRPYTNLMRYTRSRLRGLVANPRSHEDIMWHEMGFENSNFYRIFSNIQLNQSAIPFTMSTDLGSQLNRPGTIV
jgi:hypothetical protein